MRWLLGKASAEGGKPGGEGRSWFLRLLGNQFQHGILWVCRCPTGVMESVRELRDALCSEESHVP